MQKDEKWQSFQKIRPDAGARARMLANILENSPENQQKGSHHIMKNRTLKRTLTAAACAAAAFVCIFAAGHFIQPEKPQITVAVPAEESPNSPRKFLNYHGHRYAFLENGASFSLTDQALSEKLGTLEFDILSDPKENSKKEFSATFAIGGTLHEMKNYEPEFRLAVKFEGQYYICESVDAADDAEVNVREYFETADFAETTKEIRIYDHFDREILDTVSGKDVKKMVDLLEECLPAELTDDQYQEIGQAQRNGQSFHLAFQLEDGTQYRLYVIPSLSIAMIGDNKYVLSEDFLETYGERFSGLKQQPVPMG